MTTCGDFGGVNSAGEPCGRRVVDGPCPAHSKAADDELATKKAGFLEQYATGVVSLEQAAKSQGVSRVTVWRWRREDAEFDKAVSGIQAKVDEIRTALVEESLFTRILGGKASAAETIFWLVNRSRGRWKHVQHVVQSNMDIDLDGISDEGLERIEAGEDPAKVVADELRQIRNGEAA